MTAEDIAYWSYRVVRFREGDGEHLQVQEVYFDSAGRPVAYCDASPGGSDWGELGRDATAILAALDQPAIDAELMHEKESE